MWRSCIGEANRESPRRFVHIDFEFLGAMVRLRVMRRRWFSLAIALFEAFFLNVVVPGHQRGVVQLPGSDSSSGQSCPFCCCGQNSSPANSKLSQDNNSPKRAGTCAICAFAAHLSVPPVFNFSLAPLMPLGPLEIRGASLPIAGSVQLPFNERGPPAVA